MKEQIEKYKKFSKRKQRIMNVLNNHPCEKWYDALLEKISSYDKEFGLPGYYVEALTFDTETFNITWKYHGNYAEDDDWEYTDKVPLTFFNDPVKYFKDKKEREDAEKLAKEQREALARRDKYLALLAELKKKYE